MYVYSVLKLTLVGCIRRCGGICGILRISGVFLEKAAGRAGDVAHMLRIR